MVEEERRAAVIMVEVRIDVGAALAELEVRSRVISLGGAALLPISSPPSAFVCVCLPHSKC